MTISVNNLVWNSDTKTFTAEASRFPGIFGNDKVKLKNPETENIVEFRKDDQDISSAGELLAVRYVGNTPEYSDIIFVVFND